MAPGQPAMKVHGTESVRSLGGLWVLAEGSVITPEGKPDKVLFTFGYDPERKKFVGSFIGSMMTNMWLYEGSLDAAGKVLTLDTQGPSFAGDGSTSPYQDIVEVIDANHRLLKSRVLGADGKWTEFMTARYRRN